MPVAKSIFCLELEEIFHSVTACRSENSKIDGIAGSFDVFVILDRAKMTWNLLCIIAEVVLSMFLTQR